MNYQTIQDLVTDRRWEAGKGMSAWDSDSNYIGTRPVEWVVGLSKTRDSGLLTNCNFDVLLDMLGGESEGVVDVVRIGHWACGWVEQILVHSSAVDKLEILLNALNKLDDYPILDESEYGEAEQDYQNETFDLYKSDWQENLAKYLGVDEIDTAEAEIVLSCLYSYECGSCGTEDAYLDADDFARLTQSCRYELTDYAREGNKLARKMLRFAGVPMVPKRK